MAQYSMSCLQYLILVLSTLSLVSSSSLLIQDDPIFEWTGLGDSYASGVGAGEYVDGMRCLRYDGAYPVQFDAVPKQPPAKHLFHNCVCSGASTEDVDLYQFQEKDTWGVPSLEYGSRPRFGTPSMATLTVGGDNIDFQGILFNCMLDTTLKGGPAAKTCDQQRRESWALINDPKLVTNISNTIQKIVDKGRSGPIGASFRLYVTGYAEFFNEVDIGCDTVTFARTANPNPDGKFHTLLTTTIRADFNMMSAALNAVIEAAVKKHTAEGVTYIDIQANGVLDGHRYCEPGIKEPDQKNPKLYFMHYPYNEPKTSNISMADSFLDDADVQALNATNMTAREYEDAVFQSIDWVGLNASNSNATQVWNPWPDVVGVRAKLFHPAVQYSALIKNMIMNAYVADANLSSVSSTTLTTTSLTISLTTSPTTSPTTLLTTLLTTSSTTSSTTSLINSITTSTTTSTTISTTVSQTMSASAIVPAPTDSNACHGVSGKSWVVSRDIAVANAVKFCSQNLKSAEYSSNTDNYARYSINYPPDESKGIPDPQLCIGIFTKAVIDGCDGNDPVNNPQNYKYGSVFTSASGWVYTMTPLAVPVDTDSCDVTWKLVYDKFNIRGKNFPGASIGVNGAGLKKQLDGCGAVTDWKFEMTPADTTYQWYATGHLPIGTKACVGRAVESAGGTTKGNCKGAG